MSREKLYILAIFFQFQANELTKERERARKIVNKAIFSDFYCAPFPVNFFIIASRLSSFAANNNHIMILKCGDGDDDNNMWVSVYILSLSLSRALFIFFQLLKCVFKRFYKIFSANRGSSGVCKVEWSSKNSGRSWCRWKAWKWRNWINGNNNNDFLKTQREDAGKQQSFTYFFVLTHSVERDIYSSFAAVARDKPKNEFENWFLFFNSSSSPSLSLSRSKNCYRFIFLVFSSPSFIKV